MNPAAAFLFGVLVGWITLHLLIHRPDRRNRAIKHRAEVDGLRADLDILRDAFTEKYREQAAAIIAAEGAQHTAEADLEWERIERFKAEAERDIAQAAFRGEMWRQVRGETLRPDDQVGEVQTFESHVWVTREHTEAEQLAEWERDFLTALDREQAEPSIATVTPIERGAK